MANLILVFAYEIRKPGFRGRIRPPTPVPSPRPGLWVRVGCWTWFAQWAGKNRACSGQKKKSRARFARAPRCPTRCYIDVVWKKKSRPRRAVLAAHLRRTASELCGSLLKKNSRLRRAGTGCLLKKKLRLRRALQQSWQTPPNVPQNHAVRFIFAAADPKPTTDLSPQSEFRPRKPKSN